MATLDLSSSIHNPLKDPKAIGTIVGVITSGIIMLIIVSLILCCYREPWERPWPFRKPKPADKCNMDPEHGFNLSFPRPTSGIGVESTGSSQENLVEAPLEDMKPAKVRGQNDRTRSTFLEVPSVNGRGRLTPPPVEKQEKRFTFSKLVGENGGIK
jgi:hypothetical protein